MNAQLWMQIGTAVIPMCAAYLAYRQATRVARITADSADRTKLTDDLQEEVGELRKVVGETRKDADAVRFRLRALSDYLDLCLAHMRLNGLEPPPVPAMARRPWEEP